MRNLVKRDRKGELNCFHAVGFDQKKLMNVDERDIKHAVECGANDFITKPFPPEVLERHVRQVVGRAAQ